MTEGLDVHPSSLEQLHGRRPQLPEGPSTEHVEAWIELAGIVRDLLEDAVSRRAIAPRYGDPAAGVRDIADRARTGEESARRLPADVFTGLGAVLARACWTSARPPWSSGAQWPAPGTSSPRR